MSPIAAQRYHISYAPNSQEGLFLQLIEQLDGDAKITQMEAFLSKYPQHASSAWVLSYLQEYYSDKGDIEKAINAGEKLLALHPEDLEAALLNQKLAVRNGDPALVRKWGEAAKEAARQLAASKGQAVATASNFKDRQEYATGVVANAEYDTYKTAAEADKPELRVRLLEAFLKEYPKSTYVTPAMLTLMNAYRVTGAAQKALDIAEKLLSQDANNESALVTVAQAWLDRRSNYPRVISICNKLIATYSKPPAAGDTDFEKRKAIFAGAAYQMLGYAYVFQNQFEDADRNLRLGLVFAKGNPQIEAGLLFYIGYSNYYLEKYTVAADFFRQCIAIPSPFQDKAQKQIAGMKLERRIPED
jgi:tetratricopeptide (TPR) repeat protein